MCANTVFQVRQRRYMCDKFVQIAYVLPPWCLFSSRSGSEGLSRTLLLSPQFMTNPANYYTQHCISPQLDLFEESSGTCKEMTRWRDLWNNLNEVYVVKVNTNMECK